MRIPAIGNVPEAHRSGERWFVFSPRFSGGINIVPKNSRRAAFVSGGTFEYVGSSSIR